MNFCVLKVRAKRVIRRRTPPSWAHSCAGAAGASVAMFRKRANLRGGKKAEARDDDAEEEPGVLSASATAKSAKGGTGAKDAKSKKPAAKAALLSFEDDEADADVFQVKKSKEKKRSMRAPDARLADTQPAASAAGGAYSSQALRELHEAQKSFGARPSEHLDPNAPVEIKLRGALKVTDGTVLPPPLSRDPVRYVPPPPPRGAEVGGASANPAPATVDVEMADTAVPDAAAITAAKAQREQMRTAAARGKKTPDIAMTDVVAEADGGEWEDQQLRKAMSVRGAAPPPKTGAPRGPSGARGVNASGTEEDIVAGGARALASLRGGAANASSTSRAAEEELKRAEASLASSEAMLETYQERLSSAGERYAFMQELRDYFRDLCQCLHDKEPIIAELETQAHRLHEARAAASASAAATDAADERAEAEAAAAAAQAALMRGAAREEAAAEAQAAGERARRAVLGRREGARAGRVRRDAGAARRAAAARRAVGAARSAPPSLHPGGNRRRRGRG